MQIMKISACAEDFSEKKFLKKWPTFESGRDVHRAQACGVSEVHDADQCAGWNTLKCTHSTAVQEISASGEESSAQKG